MFAFAISSLLCVQQSEQSFKIKKINWPILCPFLLPFSGSHHKHLMQPLLTFLTLFHSTLCLASHVWSHWPLLISEINAKPLLGFPMFCPFYLDHVSSLSFSQLAFPHPLDFNLNIPSMSTSHVVLNHFTYYVSFKNEYHANTSISSTEAGRLSSGSVFFVSGCSEKFLGGEWVSVNIWVHNSFNKHLLISYQEHQSTSHWRFN